MSHFQTIVDDYVLLCWELRERAESAKKFWEQVHHMRHLLIIQDILFLLQRRKKA
jgi:hypothetical protein